MFTLRLSKRIRFTSLMLAVLAIAFSSCQKESLNKPQGAEALRAGDASAATAQQNIVEIAISDPTLSTLVAAVVKTDLVGTLSDPGVNLTVFAPDDNAFSKLPAPFNNAANVSAITSQEEIDALTSLLLYHVLGAEVFSSAIANGRSSATTLKAMGTANDNTIYLSKTNARVGINGAAKVTAADVDASNGVIHKVDRVLVFPTRTIADIAVANPNLTALVAALVKTDLVGLFAAPGDYTVWAPTDAAFAQLPAPLNNAENISGITDAATIAALSNILRYHVAASRYFSPDFGVPSLEVPTLADAPSNTIITAIGPLRVKGNSNAAAARVARSDVFSTNGVIHVIDKVLRP